MKRFTTTALVLLALCLPATAALAQDTAVAPAPPRGAWELFLESRDVFTVLLLAGSVGGIALIFMAIFEVRETAFLPKGLAGRCTDLARTGRVEALAEAVRDGESFFARVVSAAAARAGTDRVAIRDAAELTASEESARWFRRIELLSTIGNMGPLIGLAGTVWGMILAFTSLGDRDGQAGPADLSLGISKALFHTLLGLCLAIPCLFAYALLRGKIDRLCTRATIVASDVIELIAARSGDSAPRRKDPA
ncbi:MAG: MotA/TolQ/ExbB proton channel family protein [Phycisphaerales bacterium]